MSFDLPENLSDGNATISEFLPYVADFISVKSSTDLFLHENSIRPGVLVLINDVDWELEGKEKYTLQNNDNIVFISTLHGG